MNNELQSHEPDGINGVATSWRAPSLETIKAQLVPARWWKIYEKQGGVPQSAQNEPYSFAFPNGQGIGGFAWNASGDAPSKPDPTVQCLLCPRKCVIAPNKLGKCSARVNRGGSLYARFYARPVSTAIDPIEKKPLYHFLPTTTILSLGTFGCNLSCKFCQNWTLSRSLSLDETVNNILPPERVLQIAIERKCPSVAFTYNEPTIWAEYVIETARLCKEHGIKTVAVTNGMISGQARDDFYDVIDAANVDLKAFSESFYHNLADGRLEDVKSTLLYLAQRKDVWLEVTNLIIPTLNDSEDELRAMCEWLVQNLGDSVPLHFSAFFPAHRITDLPRTPKSTLERAKEIADSAGLKFVYLGNVDDERGGETRCPKCGTPLVRRSYRYATKITEEFQQDPDDSTARICAVCKTPIPGVFQ